MQAFVRGAREEAELYRDARAALRELRTLGCRSNDEIDRLLREDAGGA